MSAFRSALIALLLVFILAGIVASGALAQETEQTIDVVGQILYADHEGRLRPASGVEVTIRDWDGCPSNCQPSEALRKVLTDEDGFFAALDVDNEDLEGSPRRPDRTGQDIAIEVRTKSLDEDPEITLLNASRGTPFVWSSYPTGFIRNVEDGETVTLNLDIHVSDQNIRGMRVFQTMRLGWDILSQEPDLDAPIVAEWGSRSVEGPHYERGGRIYYDAGAATFPHVILHHFAHALAWVMQGDAGYPASCFPTEHVHTFTLRTEASAECAWVEGWAIGFSMIALGDPEYRTELGARDLEAPDADTPGWEDGDTVAGRVAGALWDLFDDVDDGFDTHTPAGTTPQERFAPMWESYLAGTPTTTREFWDAYLAGGYDACSGVRAFFQNTIDYNNAPLIQELPTVTVPEDSDPEIVLDLWEYASDVECPDDQLTFTLVEEVAPEFGVTIEDNRYVRVDPAADWFASVRVGIAVSDGLETSEEFFTLTIEGVNDAPTLGEIPQFEALVNEPIVVDLSPYVDDVDDDKSELTASVTLLDHATVEIDGLVLTFTPETDYVGSDFPHVKVEDSAGDFAETQLVLKWSLSPNQPPKIVDLPPVWPQDIGFAIRVDFTPYGEDAEDSPEELTWDVLSISYESPADQGKVTVQPASGPERGRVFTFVPATEFAGSAFVRVAVADTGGGRSAPAEIELRWRDKENEPPFLVKPIGDRKEFIGRPLTLNLEGYADDVDDNPASLIWFPNKATVDCCQISVPEGQRIIFFPLPGWGAQTDTVELVVRDPRGAETRTEVVLTWDFFKILMPLINKNASGP